MHVPTPTMPAQGFPAPQRRKSWLNNWKILVPVLILVIALCFGLFVFAILSFVYSLIHNSYPYKMAIQSANASTQVTAEIGTPIHVAWWTTGNINYNNSDADAQFSIPISGPRGSGHIIVVGKKRAGRWTFQTFEVDVDGQNTPIQLMNPAPAPALPPVTAPVPTARPGSV